MLLIYIKQVRQHLLKINNCANIVKHFCVEADGTKQEWETACVVESPCLECQERQIDLLEWAETHFDDITNDYTPTPEQLRSHDYSNRLTILEERPEEDDENDK